MIAKIFLYLFTFAVISTSVQGKTYKRCEFIKELVEKHNFNDEDAVKVACVAEVSRFETHRTMYHEERLENEMSDRNLFLKYASFKPNYGIFQISSEYWCSETEVGGICNVNCKDFLDDDITDDIECFKKIAPNLTDSTLSYDWKLPWIWMIDFNCPNSDLHANCSLRNESLKDWSSLDDCFTNFPNLKHFELIPIHIKSRVRFDHEFPHAASIGWSNPINSTIDWRCGGSLISEDTILTAAHCFKGKDIGLPDVVRLGDLNFETDTDEKEAQQLEVLSTHVHPDYTKRIHDIALIKLKAKVNLTKFVLPACLWDKHDLPREVNLEACGRGRNSPPLLKNFLSAISIDECDEHYYGTDRYLQEGLSEKAHVCAGDKSGVQLDTCRGDSGGPLEMKLHYDEKLVPFIVGVFSFGKNGEAGTPGVYARVSSYIDWIKEQVPDLTVNAVKCSEKYEELRLVDNKTTYYKIKFEPEKFVYGDKLGENTTATIISDQFLIAAASNLKKMSNPKRVHFTTNSSDILIEKIVYHPKYVEGKLENDLALIKLKSRIRWKYKDNPACVTRKDITVNYYSDSHKGLIFQDEKPFKIREPLKNWEIDNCLPRNETNADSSTENLLCFKTFNVYHVPDYCTVPVGSAIFFFPYEERHKRVIKGLTIQSHDCTFTLATDVSKYYEWINSVVFGSEAK